MPEYTDESDHKPKTTRQVVRDVFRGHTCWHDPALPDELEAAVENLIAQCEARAWDEGVIAAHRSDLTLFAIKQVNPHRVIPPGTSGGEDRA